MPSVSWTAPRGQPTGFGRSCSDPEGDIGVGTFDVDPTSTYCSHFEPSPYGDLDERDQT